MKKAFLSLFLLMLPIVANAADGRELYLDIRRIGLDLSKTTVRNAKYYQDSPVTALRADDQEFVKGVWDTALQYNVGDLHWENALFMEYGKTTIQPYDGDRITNENADKFLLSSNLAWARWHFGDLKFGPLARASYQTEFVPNANASRQNVIRVNAGLSLFDHPIIKSLYVTGLYEYDFTYTDNPVNKGAIEAGWRLEYAIRDGVKISTNGYYREYLTYSAYEDTDLKRDFSADLRMDTNLWNNFTMGPYVQYRIAKSRSADYYGSNLIIGLSFNYIVKYDLLNYDSKE